MVEQSTQQIKRKPLRAARRGFLFICCLLCSTILLLVEQDAQLSQRDRAAVCVIVFAKSRRLELGDNILRTL